MTTSIKDNDHLYCLIVAYGQERPRAGTPEADLRRLLRDAIEKTLPKD